MAFTIEDLAPLRVEEDDLFEALKRLQPRWTEGLLDIQITSSARAVGQQHSQHVQQAVSLLLRPFDELRIYLFFVASIAGGKKNPAQPKTGLFSNVRGLVLVDTQRNMPSALFEQLALRGSKQFMPAFLYGTAWKKEKTSELVFQAICSGFRGVDTAAQPKHYREDLVGEGVRRALNEGEAARDDLFIQTKFTSVHGQDPNKMPYNPRSSITEQVHTSIRSSLHNLRPSTEHSSADSTFLDCLVLHSPLPTLAETMEAWTTAETYVPHKIRHLGISNVQVGTLERLYEAATVKPAVVQNRFYLDTHFDVRARAFCVDKGIIYQAFWTVSANPKILYGAEVSHIANQIGLSNYEAMYCLVLALKNVMILNGTKSKEHMIGDLEALHKAKVWASKNPESWDLCMKSFNALIGHEDVGSS